MPFDSFGSDEFSMFDLADRAEGFLAGFLQIGTEYRLEFDELLVFLLVGILNVTRQKGDLFFIPASLARINAAVKLSRETLRRRLLDLQGRGLLGRTRQGFVISDFVVWRRLARLLPPVALEALGREATGLTTAAADSGNAGPIAGGDAAATEAAAKVAPFSAPKPTADDST